MNRLPKKYFKSITDYVMTYYTADGVTKYADKLYNAVKTVTKDFTRTDPVYVRIGEDGEPEIHYTMTQADGSYYFANMDLGKATLYVRDTGICTSVRNLADSLKASKFVFVGGSKSTSFYEMIMDTKDMEIDLTIDCGTTTSLLWAFRNYFGTSLKIALINEANVTNWMTCFGYDRKITTIPAIDLSGATNLRDFAIECNSVTSFHCTGMKVSFDLSYCLKMSREALLEVFNNLADLTGKTSATLTIGSALGAKITNEDRLIVTNKNWNLAE